MSKPTTDNLTRPDRINAASRCMAIHKERMEHLKFLEHAMMERQIMNLVDSRPRWDGEGCIG